MATSPIPSQSYLYRYAVAATLTPNAAGATTVLQMQGSGSRICVVTRLKIYGTSTLGVNNKVSVEIRSSAATGGTPTNQPTVNFDQANPPATATVTTFTGVPTAGTLIGTLAADALNLQVGSVLPIAVEYDFPFSNQMYGPVLRDANTYLTVTLGGIAIVGGNITVTVEWAETPP